MKLISLMIVALAACNSTPAPTPAPPIASAADPALAKRVDAVIDQALAAQHLVGTVVVIARDGQVVYARAAGLADREAKLPVREDTLFRIASMTKPIVGAAALALVDQGKLSLDDPVTKFLPEFRPKLRDGSEAVIKVRHLLTHTSGLSYKFIEPAGGPLHAADVSDGLAEPGFGAEENLRRLATVPLAHAPGAAWTYGLSFDVLGEVVARAGGGTLPEVLARVITGPLGMADTTFVATDRARLAWPYAEGKPPVRMTEPYDAPMDTSTVRFSPARAFDAKSFPSGGAGLVGTARDYLRFAEALRTGGAPILKPATAQAFHENQVGTIDLAMLGPGMRFGFGVGVTTAESKSRRGPGTFGWSGIYGTGFWIDPQARLSVVIFTNYAGDSPFEGQLEQAIYGPK